MATEVTSYANSTDTMLVMNIGLNGVAPAPIVWTGIDGGKPYVDANGQNMKILKCRRWGGPKNGNTKNAKWRRQRGGAFCMPINSKFKSGNTSKR